MLRIVRYESEGGSPDAIGGYKDMLWYKSQYTYKTLQSVFIVDVMLLLELCQLLFSTC